MVAGYCILFSYALLRRELLVTLVLVVIPAVIMVVSQMGVSSHGMLYLIAGE